MRLEIHDLWSPDLNPPSSGLPPDIRNFSVFMQVAVSQKLHRGDEVFGFFACSSERSTSESQPSLCFDAFDWSAVRERVAGVLNACGDCKTWDEVIAKLAPQLEYADK